MEQPRFWHLVTPTLIIDSLDVQADKCYPESLDTFLEHGIPLLTGLPKRIPHSLLMEIANRPHLHQHLPDDLRVASASQNIQKSVDLCEVMDMLTKIKVQKLTLPSYWCISDWSLF